MTEQSEVADPPAPQSSSSSIHPLRRLLQRFKPTRRRLLLLAVAILFYALVMFPLGCGTFLANRLMLFPSTESLATYGATEHFIETPAGRVQVFIAQSPNTLGRPPERFVLHLMGNGSRAEHQINAVAARWGADDVPTEAWAMNYPGYGASAGPATLDKLAPAAMAVFDALAERAGNAPIYLDGDSLGTTIALHLAVTKPVAGMVLKNPPPLRQLVMGQFGWWNLWLLAAPVASAIPLELDSVANAQKCESPAIFVLAGRDTLIPPAYQRRVLNAYAGPKAEVALKEANHNTAITAAEESAIRAAIAEHLNP